MSDTRTAEDREYGAKYLPIHLIEADMIDKLRELMQNPDFLAEAAEFGMDWPNDPRVKAALAADN